MALILHAGAEPVDYNGLRQLQTPPATETHLPVPHHKIVDLLKHSLSYYGHEITEEHFGVTSDGMRFFGVLTLKSAYGDWTDMVGCRNSHDRTMPIGVSIGSRVMVCDNMAFHGDHVIKRKHTPKAMRDLVSLLAEIVEPLQAQREQQFHKLDGYKHTALSDMMADHTIMRMYREDVINVQRIPEVLSQWNEPTHDYGEKTAWRLLNAATFVLQGKVVENPKATTQLHNIIDSTCSLVH